MTIIRNQYISVKNVLSYLTRISSRSLGDFFDFIRQNSSALDLNVNGKIMFYIIGMHDVPGDITMDIEVLVPVDKSFESNGKYIYKPEFRLENAVGIRYYGSYNGLISAQKKISDYIADNKLTPITNTYCIVDKNEGDDSIVSLYVGINGNIL